MIIDRLKSIVNNKRNIATGTFTAGRLVCTFLHVINGLVLVRLLDPADLGFFNKNTVVLGYLLFCTAGIFSGLSRELPYYIGKKDITTAHALTAVANAFAIVLGAIAFVLFGGMALKYGIDKQYWLCAVWGSNAIVAFQTIYKLYLGVTFRTHQDFVRLASIDVSIALVSLASLVLVWRWQYYGLCVRTVFVALISLIVMYHLRPLRVAPHWDFTKFRHLFKIGIPIFLTGYIVAWWGATMSLTWIAWKCSDIQMGLYTFPVFVFSTVTLFSSSFTQVYYPRMTQAYATNENIRGLFRILMRPLALLLVIHVIILIVGWLLMPYAVHLLAPKYIESVFPAQLMLLNLLIFWFDPALRIFYIIKKTGFYFVCIIVGIVINVFFLFFLEHRMDALSGVIVASILGRTCYRLLSIAVLFYLSRVTCFRVSAAGCPAEEC
jgi:O-antigen/teichoic acid export membrane protein